jgi:prepilin-type N-terminal cleavage/methylation domain-containing protein
MIYRIKNGRLLSGFTLVELLVVISIIALLLAVLMPALGKARESAKSTVCKSGFKQFSVALVAYSMDNRDEYLKQGAGNNVTWSDEEYWFGRIAPYINLKTPTSKTSEFMRCPSGQSIKDYNKELVFSWLGTDYGLQQANGGKVTKLASIIQPSKFVSFFDWYYGQKKLGRPYTTDPDGLIPTATGDVYYGKWDGLVGGSSRFADFFKIKVYRHSQHSINAVYLDSHVKNLKDPNWWDDFATPSSYGWDKRTSK